MTPEDFAVLVCAQLMQQGDLKEDSRAHRALSEALAKLFPTVRESVVKDEAKQQASNRYR